MSKNRKDQRPNKIRLQVMVDVKVAQRINELADAMRMSQSAVAAALLEDAMGPGLRKTIEGIVSRVHLLLERGFVDRKSTATPRRA